MQLSDLIKPLGDMTMEELEARLQAVRSRRDSGASRKNKEKKQVRKDTTRKVTATEKLLEGLSQEELATLLTQLEAQK